MRRWLALALAITPPAVHAQAHPRERGPASPGAIFRYIVIGDSGRIELGRPFVQRSVIGKPAGPHLYRLVGPGGKPTSFGGTEAILVDLNADSLVRAFHFIYPPGDRTFRERVETYTQVLGPPRIEVLDSVGVHVRQAHWEDNRTTFDVIETTSAGEVRQRAVLIDRRPKIDGR